MSDEKTTETTVEAGKTDAAGTVQLADLEKVIEIRTWRSDGAGY